MDWRLIIDKENDAFMNMAIDKAIILESKIPTLRLYQWKPAAVSIGCFQSLDDEVDVDKCKEYGIDYVRRMTGGGAVFHENELTYSICIEENNAYFSKDLRESYRQICDAIIIGLKEINLNAEYAFLNDILVNGKKISGCAQTRRNGKILQHGTLILDVNVDRMFELLRVPDEKIKGKQISQVKERVTSINKELGKEISIKQVERAIVLGFEKKFNIKFFEGKLSEGERILARKLKGEFEKNEFKNFT